MSSSKVHLAFILLPGAVFITAILSQIAVASSSQSGPHPASAAPAVASFVYPVQGQQNVDTSRPFQWTAAPGAISYSLSIGSTPGARNVVDSGPLKGLTHSVPPLPAGPTLYATLLVQTPAGVSYASAISFTAAFRPAVLLQPADGENLSAPSFRWTGIAGASAYYLYVGTTEGAKDVVDSGEIQATSYMSPSPLPVATPLYARIYTKWKDQWYYAPDVRFTLSASVPEIIYPGAGAVNVDVTRPLQWTPVANADAYSVTVGTTMGGDDLFSSGPIHETSVTVGALPIGENLWLRVAASAAGKLTYADASFTAALIFVHPRVGSSAVDPAAAFEWSPAATLAGHAPNFELTVGTTPAAGDILDTGNLGATTAYAVPARALTLRTQLYARVIARLGDGSVRRADTVFTTQGTPLPLPQMTYPGPAQSNVDVSNAFRWTQVDLATAYRLQIYKGTAVAADSGPIHVPMYFAESLAAGSYTGKLGTQIGGRWYWSSFAFAVSATGYSMAKETAAAMWATDWVRHMADLNGYAYAWTTLWAINNQLHITPNCTQFRDALLQALSEMNVAARLPASQQPRILNIDLNDNGYDTHTLVEMWNTDQQSWMILDPTFALTVRRADGTWASRDDVHAATMAKNWGALSFTALGSFGDGLARAYYIDYPLLYLNTPESGSPRDLLPYFRRINGMPAQPGLYAVQSASSPVTLLVDGSGQSFDCSGIDSMSRIFNATTVALPARSSAQVTVYQPMRFVF